MLMTRVESGENEMGKCYDPGPYPNFLLFSTLLFALSVTPLFTRSLTRRSDRHQIT